MSATLRVLSFDPSLRNWGWVFLSVGNETDSDVLPLDSGTIQVVSNEGKRNLALADRSEKLFSEVCSLIQRTSPDFIVAELPIGAQSANAMQSFVVCCTLIGILRALGNTVHCVSPYAVKNVVGIPHATKKEICNWVNNKFPKLLAKHPNGSVNIAASEHIADAICVYLAFHSEDTLMQLKQSLMLTAADIAAALVAHAAATIQKTVEVDVTENEDGTFTVNSVTVTGEYVKERKPRKPRTPKAEALAESTAPAGDVAEAFVE